jgi:hypothetical protein
MKLKKEDYTITDFNKPDLLLMRLYKIMKETVWPAMDYRFFLQFYLNSQPHCIQVTFLQAAGRDEAFLPAPILFSS